MSIDQLIELGDDQISSQFKLEFPTGLPGGGNPDNLSMRADQSFDPPERRTGKYSVFYQGQKIEKTNVVEETDKTFELQFRCDQEWDIYNALDSWFKLTYDEENGTASNDADTRTDMVLRAIGTNKTSKKTIKYVGVKIESIKINEFNHETGDPLRITCNFIYYKQINV